ncbi:hypothetical protein HOG48_02145 [Candidatus Peregrinibacteria bacterium]|nr:hypothetical protein [Candidatus Peregrinibacteria bacterium]
MSFSYTIANERKCCEGLTSLLQAKELEYRNTRKHFPLMLYKIGKAFSKPSIKKVKKTLDSNQISYLEVEIESDSLNLLHSDMPISGKQYVPIRMESGGDWIDAELKYRGDSYYHWGFEKKSYTIKRENGAKLNLINPKNSNFIADRVAMTVANDFGLLNPKYDWIGLFVNDEFKGVFSLVEGLDDKFATANDLDFILEGERLSFSLTTGQPLFFDTKKWSLAAGQMVDDKQFSNFLKAINTKDYKAFFGMVDLDYMARFYTWASLIKNHNYDSTHNWRLGHKQGTFYPTAWDPVAWLFVGEGIEEVNSPVSSLLRRNSYFNQLFVETLWHQINSDLSEKIMTYIDENQNQLKDLLQYDDFKGGAYHNPKRMRFPQETGQILESMDELKTTAQKRIDTLKTKLQNNTLFYKVRDNYLYIEYNGIAGSYLDSIYNDQIFEGFGAVETFNDSQYETLPTFLASKRLLVGGRVIAGAYATYCPLVYRIPIDSNRPLDIVFRHSLTDETMSPEVKDFEISDCHMNFDIPQIHSTSTAPSKNPILKLDFKQIGVAEFFDFNEKSKEKIQIKIDDLDTKGKFEKDKYSDLITMKFDDYYLNNDEFSLIERLHESENFVRAQAEAKSLHLPTPSAHLVSVEANNFHIGDYYLIEAPSKAFIEKNKLTSDTDIYRKTGFDTLSVENWDKITTDPRVDEDSKDILADLLEKAQEQKDLEKYIDTDNFTNFYNFIKHTGNENLDYLIYYDNTQGKYLFIPYYYSYYKSDNFEIRDPLIMNIFNYMEGSGKVAVLGKSNLGPLAKYQKGDQIILKKDINIKDTVTIPSNLELIIKPGVQIEIAKKESIISYGKIIAEGTKNNPIVIKSKGKKPFGVFALIGEGANDSVIKFVNVKNGSETFYNNVYISGMFSAYHVGNITVANSKFEGSQSDDGLNIKYATATIVDSVFENNSADAIDLDFVVGTVKNSTFDGNGNDSIDTSGSTVVIRENIIKKSGDKCISVGENSSATVENNLLSQCNIGIEAKDLSKVTATNNIFDGNKTALNAYQKKEFFGGATINVIDSVFKDNLKKSTLENTFKGKKLKTDDSKIEIR